MGRSCFDHVLLLHLFLEALPSSLIHSFMGVNCLLFASCYKPLYRNKMVHNPWLYTREPAESKQNYSIPGALSFNGACRHYPGVTSVTAVMVLET